MEPLGIALVILWLIAGFFNAAKKRGQSQRPKPRAPRPPSPPPPALGGQRRGGILEQFRAELERIQREAELAEGRGPRQRPLEAGPRGRPAGVRLPEAEDVEETETLEIEPVVVSREYQEDRGYRIAIDQDQQAEVVAARRVQEAQARNRPLTLADHRAFDKRIRAKPEAAPRGKRIRPALQEAMIWREVLGPPVALRNPER